MVCVHGFGNNVTGGLTWNPAKKEEKKKSKHSYFVLFELAPERKKKSNKWEHMAAELCVREEVRLHHSPHSAEEGIEGGVLETEGEQRGLGFNSYMVI